MIDSYVTGSRGFIGRHLLPKLEGNTVAVRHEDIQYYDFQPYRRFFFLSTYGNMAGHQNEQMTVQANIYDPGRVTQFSVNSGYRPELFIYVSSSSVTLPVQTLYSQTKRAAEEMVRATDLPTCIVRPYSITGVGEQPQHLIPTLIRSCLESEPMNFVPDASHDYVDVEDVVYGLTMLADKNDTGTFEFGSGIPIRNEQVKFLVESITGAKAKIREVKNLRPYDTNDWFCREPAEGWVPTKNIAQSITEMVDAYKQEKKAAA